MSLVCIVIIILVAIVSGYLIYTERIKDKYCNCSGMDSMTNSSLYKLWQSSPLQTEQVLSNGQISSYPSRLISLSSIPGAKLPPGAIGATMNSGLATTTNYSGPMTSYSSACSAESSCPGSYAVRSYSAKSGSGEEFRIGVL